MPPTTLHLLELATVEGTELDNHHNLMVEEMAEPLAGRQLSGKAAVRAGPAMLGHTTGLTEIPLIIVDKAGKPL